MKKEITYLFGAGASYYSMPLVENFPTRFSLFRNFVQGLPDDDYKISFTKDCDDFFNQVKHHLSFDTFFKKLFHLPQRSPRTYKYVLLAYFLFEHLLDITNYPVFNEQNQIKNFGHKKGNLDPRYDALIAGLLEPIENNFSFLCNVNFLTWNYDLNLITSIQNFINPDWTISAFIKEYENSINYFKFKDDISLIHLNGHVNYPLLKELGPIESEVLKRYFRSIIRNEYSSEKLLSKESNLLKFSWETLSETSKVEEMPFHINKAVDAIKKSDVIVIVGYSFPLYNRRIDSKLINSINLKNKIVYIQDPNANDIEAVLRQDFSLGSNLTLSENSNTKEGIRIKKIQNCNSFFVPSSLF